MREIRNCPVAVIGGAGFLGSHLVQHLLADRGCRVIVVDNLVAGRREFVPREAVFAHHDITGSEEYLHNLFTREQVRYVFNYAAFPYIPDSFTRPLHVSNVNFFGAMKVINAAQEAGAEAILQISSAEIYGGLSKERTEHFQETFKRLSREARETEERPWGLTEEEVVGGFKLGETTVVCPHSSYGASKAAADYYCQVSWRERQTPVIALRQFNCVGERDELHPYVVPEIMRQLLEAKQREPKTMWNREVRLGNNSFRDFLYAGDQARMATELLEKGAFGEVYNLGSETGIKMYDLAELIGRCMKINGVKVVEDPARKRPWEIWHLQSDNTKIYSVIESRPTVRLEEAMQRTVDYFLSTGGRLAW